MSAIVFPGQGSQYLNMSMDFNENFDVARRVFQEIEDTTLLKQVVSNIPGYECYFKSSTHIQVYLIQLVLKVKYLQFLVKRKHQLLI